MSNYKVSHVNRLYLKDLFGPQLAQHLRVVDDAYTPFGEYASIYPDLRASWVNYDWERRINRARKGRPIRASVVLSEAPVKGASRVKAARDTRRASTDVIRESGAEEDSNSIGRKPTEVKPAQGSPALPANNVSGGPGSEFSATSEVTFKYLEILVRGLEAQLDYLGDMDALLTFLCGGTDEKQKILSAVGMKVGSFRSKSERKRGANRYEARGNPVPVQPSRKGGAVSAAPRESKEKEMEVPTIKVAAEQVTSVEPVVGNVEVPVASVTPPQKSQMPIASTEGSTAAKVPDKPVASATKPAPRAAVGVEPTCAWQARETMRGLNGQPSVTFPGRWKRTPQGAHQQRRFVDGYHHLETDTTSESDLEPEKVTVSTRPAWVRDLKKKAAGDTTPAWLRVYIAYQKSKGKLPQTEVKPNPRSGGRSKRYDPEDYDYDKFEGWPHDRSDSD